MPASECQDASVGPPWSITIMTGARRSRSVAKVREPDSPADPAFPHDRASRYAGDSAPPLERSSADRRSLDDADGTRDRFLLSVPARQLLTANRCSTTMHTNVCATLGTGRGTCAGLAKLSPWSEHPRKRGELRSGSRGRRRRGRCSARADCLASPAHRRALRPARAARPGTPDGRHCPDPLSDAAPLDHGSAVPLDRSPRARSRARRWPSPRPVDRAGWPTLLRQADAR